MKLSNLAGVLRDAGLTVVECAGWSNRGYAGQDLKDVRGVLWHHTATNRQRFNDSDAPTLSMCVNGRIDLAGPLCNIVFGRNGTVYLVAAGVANHAGAGSAAGVPANMGNHYLIGIEMESSGIAPWDWTPDQLRVAPPLGAALERAYGASLQIAHYEYSSQGKIDPAGWPGGMDGLRDSINSALTGSLNYAGAITATEEDDMFTDADRQAVIDARNEATNAKLAAQAAVAAVTGLLQTRLPDPANVEGYQPSLAEWIVYGNLKAGGAQQVASSLTPEVIAAAVAKASSAVDAQAVADRLVVTVKEG